MPKHTKLYGNLGIDIQINLLNIKRKLRLENFLPQNTLQPVKSK